MVRPQKHDLEPQKHQLTKKYFNGATFDDMAYELSNHGQSVSSRTLKRTFAKWGVNKREPSIDLESNPDLVVRLKYYFFILGLNDTEMLQELEAADYNIKPHALATLRQSLKLYRRTNDPEKRRKQDAIALAALVEELSTDSRIDNLGKAYLPGFARKKQLIISRDRLFVLYRQINPLHVTARLRDLQRKRGAYIVRGPDYVWSIDGYMKLQPYGIQIYAAIDAYARYVIWIYVGVSGMTAVSVLRQYLDTIKAVGYHPQVVRSDHGSETVLIADAHWQLHRAATPDIPFHHIYAFGTSTANQRIEHWWHNLNKTALPYWRDFFAMLVHEKKFKQTTLSDLLALHFVYVPILRTEVQEFVQDWNVHRIRRQKRKINAVIGKPWMLYHHPKRPVRSWSRQPDDITLARLQKDVEEWDLDEYLPELTLKWCEQKVRELGLRDLDPDGNPIAYERGSPHRYIYLALREAISQHIESDALPLLEKTVHSTGAAKWKPDPTIVRSFEETGGDTAIFQNDDVEEADDQDHTDIEAGKAENTDIESE